MAGETAEVSSIGVRLSLDASGFKAGMEAASGSLAALQKDAQTAMAGMQAGGESFAIDVTLSVSKASLTAARKQITESLQNIPVTIKVTQPRGSTSGLVLPMSAVVGSQYGMSPQVSRNTVTTALERRFGGLERKAAGGSVGALRPVIVGETRPEVFVPKTAGFIEPSIRDFYRRQEQQRRVEMQMAAMEAARQQQHERQLQHARFGRRVPMLPPGTPMPPRMRRNGGGRVGGWGSVPPISREWLERASSYENVNFGKTPWDEARDPWMYHVTNASNIESIMRRGVLPGRGFNTFQSINESGPRRSYWSKVPDPAWAHEDPVALSTRLSNIFDPEFDPIGDAMTRGKVRPEHLRFLSADKRLTRLLRRGRDGLMAGAGFSPGLRKLAQEYARSVGIGRLQEQILHPVSPEFGRRTALAYEAMPAGPDALSRRAYRAFAEETGAQYEFLKSKGFQFQAGLDDPYTATASMTKMQLAAQDVTQNRRLLAFGGSLEHPLLSNQENLDFRHVHDIFGHLTEGFSIGPRGEFNAAVKHSQMYSPLARMAMLAETHGQNSVVNFSPTVLKGYTKSIAEINKQAPGTIYAEQKARRLPQHILEEFYQRTGMNRMGGGRCAMCGGGHVSAAHAMAGKDVMAGLRPFQRAFTKNVRQASLALTPEQIEFGKAWYRRAQTIVQDMADEFGVPEPMVRGMFAAQSANTQWGGNQSKVRRILEARAAGRPFPYSDAFNPNLKARLMLEGADPWELLGHTVKTGPFFRNLGGDLSFPTIDLWAAHTATRGGLHQAPSAGPARRGIERAFLKVAKETGMEPAELQASLWLREKFLANPKYNIRAMQGGGAVQMLKDMEIAMAMQLAQERERKRAVGGPGSMKGLYIVGEIGEELFVPDHMAGMIPKRVMDQIPKARGGMQVIGKKRDQALGGELFAPPEDGIIIPHRLMDQVPHAARGIGGFEVPDWGPEMARRLFSREDRAAARQRPEMGWRIGPDGINALTTVFRNVWGRFEGERPPSRENPMPFGIASGQPLVGGYQFMRAARNRGAGRGDWPSADLPGGGFQPVGTEIVSGTGTTLAASLGGGAGGFGGARRAQIAAGRQAAALQAFLSSVPPGPAGVAYHPNVGGRQAAMHQALGGPIGGLAAALAGQQAGGGTPPPINVQGPVNINPQGNAPVNVNPAGPVNLAGPPGGGGPPQPPAPPGAGGPPGGAPPGPGGPLAGPPGGQPQQPIAYGPTAAMLEGRRAGEAGLSLRSQAMAARTPQGMAAILGALGIGGRGAGIAQIAAARRARRDADLAARRVPTAGLLELEQAEEREVLGQTPQVRAAATAQIEQYRRGLGGPGLTVQGNPAQTAAHAAAMQKLVRARDDEQAIIQKGLPGIGAMARNFAGIIASVQIYSVAMQAASEVMDKTIPVVATLVDQSRGWHATSSRITTQLSEQNRQAEGNIEVTMAQTAASAGLGMTSKDFIDNTIGATVQVKTGAQAMKETEDLFKAGIGAGLTPEGLTTGYGGLLDNIFAPNVGGIEALTGLFGNIQNQIPPPVEAQTGDYGFFKTYSVSLMESLRGTNAGRDPRLQTFFEAAVADINAAENRGVEEFTRLGVEAIRDVEWVPTDDLDKMSEFARIAEEAGVPALANLARGSHLIYTVGGALPTAAQISQINQQTIVGKGLPDLGVVMAEEARRVGVQEAGARRQQQYQVGTAIPFGLATQLLGQPLIGPGVGAPRVGVSGGARADIAGMNVVTRASQGAMQRDANRAVQDMAAFIGENLGAQAEQDFGDLMGQAQDLSGSIKSLTTDMMQAQQAASEVSYSNQIRLANRALGDAVGMLGQVGGTRLGYLEREQFLVSRAQGRLGLASQAISLEQTGLSLALQARQIATSLALAQFQAPGEAGEERYARQREAIIRAGIERQQLGLGRQQFGIQQEQFPLAQRQFAVAGQLWAENARRGATDARHAIAVMQAARDAEAKVIAAQRGIAQATGDLNQVLARAGTYVARAENRFGDNISTAATVAVRLARKFTEAWDILDEQIKSVIGGRDVTGVSTGTGQGGGGGRARSGNRGSNDDTWGASGLLGMTAGATSMMVGEAGTETVAVLRNPRMAALSMGGGGGGPTNINIQINNAQVRRDDDIEQLARKVAHHVERSIAHKGEMFGLRRPAY